MKLYPVIYRTFGSCGGQHSILGLYSSTDKAREKLDAIEAKLREDKKAEVARKAPGILTASLKGGGGAAYYGIDPAVEVDAA